jgi:hypothetical protein
MTEGIPQIENHNLEREVEPAEPENAAQLNALAFGCVTVVLGSLMAGMCWIAFQVYEIVGGALGVFLGFLTFPIILFVFPAIVVSVAFILHLISYYLDGWDLRVSSTAVLRNRVGREHFLSDRILAELARRGELEESLRQVIRAQLCSSSAEEREFGEINAAEWCPDLVPCKSTTSVVLDPAWRTAAVRQLAQAIQQDGAFDRLPILADALEEAGCDHADILNHCRSGGEHVRGCWVVDLLLARE